MGKKGNYVYYMCGADAASWRSAFLRPDITTRLENMIMVFNSIFFIFCFLPVFMLIYYLDSGKASQSYSFSGKPCFLCMGGTGLCDPHAVFQYF